MKHLVMTAKFPLEGDVTSDQLKPVVDMIKSNLSAMGAEVEVSVQDDAPEEIPTTELG